MVEEKIALVHLLRRFDILPDEKVIDLMDHVRLLKS